MLRPVVFYLLLACFCGHLVFEGYTFITSEGAAYSWRLRTKMVYDLTNWTFFYSKHADSVRYFISIVYFCSPLLLLVRWMEVALVFAICGAIKLFFSTREAISPVESGIMAADVAVLLLLGLMHEIGSRPKKRKQS